MKKFLVTFCIPAAAVDVWLSMTEPDKRKQQSDEMMRDWNAWMAEHKALFAETGSGLGKTRRVTSNGVNNYRNDLNWYGVVEAASQDDAAKAFTSHPHLRIPTAYIDVTEMMQPGEM